MDFLYKLVATSAMLEKHHLSPRSLYKEIITLFFYICIKTVSGLDGTVISNIHVQ